MRRSSPFICVLLLLASVSSAQSSSALINEALDKLVKLELNATLPEAMRAITKETGVPIQAEPAVWELLPWGEQTNINAKLENQTLRDALTAITRKLGLTFVLKDQALELQPMPALRRLGRRATVEELQALDLLASTPSQLEAKSPQVSALLDAIDKKLEAGKHPLAIENRVQNPDILNKQVSVPRTSSLLEALEAMVNQTDGTWYPWGKTIVVITKNDQVRNQLKKTVSARYNGVDVMQVLTELSQRAGVEFDIQPGAIQRIPPEFRSIRLVLDNVTIEQALDNIAGFTGLGFMVNEGGVYLWNEEKTPQAAPRDRLVAMIILDDGTQLLVTESQVPADVREYLKSKVNARVSGWRQAMKDENFVPPTTQPVAVENRDL